MIGNWKKNLGLASGLLLTTTLITQAEQKNVLFLMADDFNYWTGEDGYYPKSVTPNIDALAQSGILFKNAYCSSPVCNPSRNALLSGYRPSTTGIQGNGDGYVRDKNGFENIVTLHQYFKENGYFAYGGGKLWHPGSMGGEETDPHNWSGYTEQKSGGRGGSTYSFSSNTWSALKWGAASTFDKTANNDYILASHFAEMLSNYSTSANKGKPFFLACGLFRPHLPWQVPIDFWNNIEADPARVNDLPLPPGYKAGDTEDIPAGEEPTQAELVNNGKWKQAIHAYLANCNYADYNIGVIMKALETSGFKDNTIVVFMGDHGWQLGEKGRWGKNDQWSTAYKTTLIVMDPSATGNGQSCTKAVSLQDLYPTLVELCNLPEKDDIEGRSLAPLLNAPADSEWDWPALGTFANIHSIRTEKWCYIERNPDNYLQNELYNLESDPYEWTNLLSTKNGTPSDYQSIATTLGAKIDSMVAIGVNLHEELKEGGSGGNVSGDDELRIEAEAFDLNGNNVSYKDLSAANEGGVGLPNRVSEGVDVYTNNDSDSSPFYVGEICTSEWLNYTISQDIPEGHYNIKLRIAAPAASNGRYIKLYFDGQLLQEKMIPAEGTGGWDVWGDLEFSGVNISGGANKVLKIELSKGRAADPNKPNVNLNYLSIIGDLGTSAIDHKNSQPYRPSVHVHNKTLQIHSGFERKNIKLYTLEGKKIAQYQSSDEHFTVDLDLNKGLYLVEVETKKNRAIQKISL